MGLFTPKPCAGCVARDDSRTRELLARDAHITFLQGQIKSLQEKLVEMAEPGIVARLAPRPPRPAVPRERPEREEKPPERPLPPPL